MSTTSSSTDLTIYEVSALEDKGLDAIIIPEKQNTDGDVSFTDNHGRRTNSTASAAVILSIAMVTGVSCFLNGVVVVILPTITKQFNLSQEMQMWFVPVLAITCGEPR